MASTEPGARECPFRMITIPGLLTLAITCVRLIGELQHWPKPWFDPDSAIVGITWLAPVFGIYFAVKLARAGENPPAYGPGFAITLLGLVILLPLPFLVWGTILDHPTQLMVLWSFAAVAAVLQWHAWPALVRVLWAYGFAARIPVAIVMFFAMRGNWGTHYDAVPASFVARSLVSKYLWLAFFPQLVFWVAFTIVTGAFFGILAAAIARRMKGTPPA